MKLPLIFLPVLGCALHLFGQTPAPKPVLRVLESVEVKRGDHSIFYQRVAPPVLPTVRETRPIPENQTPSAPSPDDSAAAGKECRALFLSATVYDHRFTELSWRDRTGESRAFSNVDFNDLEGIREIETDDAIWLLVITTSNAPGDATAPSGALPLVASLSPLRAQYAIVPAATPSQAILASLDALHLFYEANRERLSAEAARRETERALAEQSPRQPPPARKDTIIKFWSVKSRVYSTSGQ